MRRRRFLTTLGLGTAATATGALKASAEEVKHDIHWARRMTEEGHRVRLVSWRTPIADRPKRDNPQCLTVQMGGLRGVESVDDLALTSEMLEGPWEIVTPEDLVEPESAVVVGPVQGVPSRSPPVTGGLGRASVSTEVCP